MQSLLRMINPFLYKSRVAKEGIATLNINPPTKVMKPPNILLYAPGRSTEKTDNAVKLIEKIVGGESYVVYSISSQKFTVDPWLENVSGLVVWPDKNIEENLVQKSKKKVDEYLNFGGNVLTFSNKFYDNIKVKKSEADTSTGLTIVSNQDQTSFDVDFTTLQAYVSKPIQDNTEVLLETKEECCKVVGVMKKMNKGKTALCLLDLLESHNQNELKLFSHLLQVIGIEIKVNIETESTDISPYGHLYTADDKHQQNIVKCLDKNMWKENDIELLHLKIDSTFWDQKNRDEDFFKVFCQPNQSNFDHKTYFEKLESKYMGQAVIYIDVINSTMSVLEGVIHKLPKETGVAVIARQQTKGQGRGGNKWLSPMGCSMFTSTLHIPIQSQLGGGLPFIQHLVSVAVVHAIRSIPKLQDIDLRVKWPNDIYFGSQVKLGGVIVKSTMYKDMCICSIGCGVNLSNAKPTVCINDIIKEKYSMDYKITSEELIAKTLSIFEKFVEDFQANGADSFLKLYYKYWIHNLVEVKFEDPDVESQSSFIEATIVGVDRYGYLQVRRHDNGMVVSLHPDGNSFDILKNLIVPKQ